MDQQTCPGLVHLLSKWGKGLLLYGACKLDILALPPEEKGVGDSMVGSISIKPMGIVQRMLVKVVKGLVVKGNVIN